MTTLYLLRHPQVRLDFKGVCYGDSDVPLEPGWESTLLPLAQRIQQLPDFHKPTEVWHSGLMRCSEPAAWLAKELQIEIRGDSRLRERHFGRWQNIAWSDIPMDEAMRVHDMLEHPSTYRPGDGETTDEVISRATAWLEDARKVLEPINTKCILAVGHSGSLTALCGALLKLPPLEWTPFYLKPSQHLMLEV
jgi:alpha-ribazole phosphatase